MKSSMEVLLVLLVLFLGSFVQSVIGMGFGLVSVGILSFIWPLQETTSLLFALACILSLMILLRLRKHIVWRQLVLITCCSLVARASAEWFVYHYDNDLWMRKVLGIVLIGMVMYQVLSSKFNMGQLQKLNLTTLAVVLGTIGGVTGGLFAVGGPFFAIYLLARSEDKNTYHANLQLMFVITNLFSLIVRGVGGQLTEKLYFYMITGVIVTLLGMILGLKCFDKLPKAKLATGVYVLVFLIGLSIIAH